MVEPPCPLRSTKKHRIFLRPRRSKLWESLKQCVFRALNLTIIFRINQKRRVWRKHFRFVTFGWGKVLSPIYTETTTQLQLFTTFVEKKIEIFIHSKSNKKSQLKRSPELLRLFANNHMGLKSTISHYTPSFAIRTRKGLKHQFRFHESGRRGSGLKITFAVETGMLAKLGHSHLGMGWGD